MDMFDATAAEELADYDSAENEKNTNPQKAVRVLNGVVEHSIQKTNHYFVFVNGLFGCVFLRERELQEKT